MSGSGYESAPATKMLATHCCACSKALVDAVSVSAGMGPDCRAKYLTESGVDETLRKEANAIVYKIAALQKGEEVIELTNLLREMGYVKLADRIADRLASVVVEENGEVLAVYTPYNEEVVAALKTVPGRKWVKEKKVNVFPKNSKPALWAVIKKHFGGKIGAGPKGLFVIPSAV